MGSALLFALAAIAGPVDSPTGLDELLAFADPQSCTPAAPFAAILDQLRDPKVPASLSVPSRYRDAFRGHIVILTGNNGRRLVTQPVSGSWHGLPVGSITLDWAPDARTPALEIHFRAPLRVSGPVLSATGLIGDGRVARPEPKGDGVSLICAANG